MSEPERRADQKREDLLQESGGEEEDVSTNVVLGAGIGILHWPNSREEEKREEKRWHEQRVKDEAAARNDARKADGGYQLEDGQPRVPRMPFPVPKDWDWRRAKRREEERHEGEKRGEGDNADKGRGENGEEERSEEEKRKGGEGSV